MRAPRWIAWAVVPALFSAADPFEAAREKMVREQIEARGVRSAPVLQALRATPRHLFVPPSAQAMAYADHPLPIGYGQTISQPYIVGFMTELLDVRREHRVLEIGTGSGYQAAILSRVAGQVYSIEIVPQLAHESAGLLSRLGCTNVTVRAGDGYLGWPEKAPFDRIILTAAPPAVPKALIGQLAVGGRLIAPEGVSDQVIVVIEKRRDGSLRRTESLPVRFVPMVH
jgi:protein-L-isoaspartate(D-aspartate) O-methyltransferase